MPDLPPSLNPTSQQPTTAPVERLSWVARARRRALDAAAQRVHDRMAASGESGFSPSSAGLLTFCVLVLVVAVVCVAWLVWATFQPKNVIGWIAVVLAWVVVYEIFPRREHADVRELPSQDFPQVDRLVRDLANGVGVAPPRVIAASIEFNAAVASLPWRRGSILVIGLPLWTCLPSEQRAALLAHELGHLRGRDTLRARIVAGAHTILFGLATMLTPLPSDAYSEFYADYPNRESSQAFSNAMGSAMLRIVSLPFVGLLLVFERLAAVESQRREYLADLNAARVAGTDATVRLFASVTNLAGLHTLAGAAVRRREDPFAVLEQVAARPALTGSEVEAARQRARAAERRWDDTHPPDDLRMSLLLVRPVSPSTAVLDAMPGAVRELAALRPELAGQLKADLLEQYVS
ncbi:M48 family metallopeptidase [Monashia sp. NPDC004114]